MTDPTPTDIPAWDAPLARFRILDIDARACALAWADEVFRLVFPEPSLRTQIRACKVLIENDPVRREVATRLLAWLDAAHTTGAEMTNA